LDTKVCWILKEFIRLSSGGSFGEMALINERPRGATIMSTKETLFAVMTKDDYQFVLKSFTQNKLNKQL